MSVELFTAALTIPSSGLTASFTCQLTTPDAQLELWVWLEPSVEGDNQNPAAPAGTVSNAPAGTVRNAEHQAGRAAWQKLVLPFQDQAKEGAADHSSSASMSDGCRR